MVELSVYKTNYHSQLSIHDRERLDLLAIVTQLSQCLVVPNKPAKTLVRKRRRPMSLSLSGETDVFKTRTAKEKRIRTDNPLEEILLVGVGYPSLHVEDKGRYMHCKNSDIGNFYGKCGVYLCLNSNRN
ncbi:hypothetical protein RF11_12133 [Thelohanellus kitauei]|uniref:Uncharacterized protein n=1 Tax=Thelohanellus kitauei TaxID=669202 RepID=A0A0C2IC75_THEKT|nr:hypothetical protein RF11_12133 [Thelohanellus kitauei]